MYHFKNKNLNFNYKHTKLFKYRNFTINNKCVIDFCIRN